MVLVLLETPAGYGLFKLNDSNMKKMTAAEIWPHFSTPEVACESVELAAFKKFKDTKAAVEAASALMEGKLEKGLRGFLKKHVVAGGGHEKLIVAESKLGSSIKEKLGIEVLVTQSGHEILRGIRTQLHNIVEGLSEKEVRGMALGLSHSINRFKLKFSPDKVDVMIVQAVGLLDDLDRELNNFAMRLREWYGWHFPELGKIITDNVSYAEAVRKLGLRSGIKKLDLNELLGNEEIAKEVSAAATISMGTEITSEDLNNIKELCERVVELARYRASLANYLKQRMQALAPNLTYVVGELVGARLISHAGSLMNLAKHPASTVQILGAEKALFRALKTKKQTPKYGLIYHASLVGASQAKLKGKISRVLAAKLALSIRVDALGDQTEATVGVEHKNYVEKRLRQLEEETLGQMTASLGKSELKRYTPDPLEIAAKKYKVSTDFNAPVKDEIKVVTKEEVVEEEEEVTPRKKKKKT